MEADEDPPADEFGLEWYMPHYNATASHNVGMKHMDVADNSDLNCPSRECATDDDKWCIETNNERESCEMQYDEQLDESRRTGCEWDRWAYACMPAEVREHKRGDKTRLYNWVNARTQDDRGNPLWDEDPEEGFGASWLGAAPVPENKYQLNLQKSYLYCVLKGVSKSPPPTHSMIKGGSFERPMAQTWTTASAFMDPSQGPPFWTVISGGVDWGKMQQTHNMCEEDCAYDGSQFLDLCAQEEGKIVQEVDASLMEHFCGLPAGVTADAPTAAFAAGTPAITKICKQQFVLKFAVNAHPTCGETTKTTEIRFTGVQMHESYSDMDGYVGHEEGTAPKEVLFTETFTRPTGKPGSAVARKGWIGNHPYFGWKEFHHVWEEREHTVEFEVDCSKVKQGDSNDELSILKMGVSFEAINDEYSCGCMMIDDVQLEPADDFATCFTPKDDGSPIDDMEEVAMPKAVLSPTDFRRWKKSHHTKKTFNEEFHGRL